MSENNRFRDGHRNPVKNGKVFITKAGSVSDYDVIDVFKDPRFKHKHTQPILLDEEGRCGDIFIPDETLFKLILKDSAGMIISVCDNQSLEADNGGDVIG